MRAYGVANQFTALTEEDVAAAMREIRLALLEAEHTCMTLRGVKKSGARTVTSAVLGFSNMLAKLLSQKEELQIRAFGNDDTLLFGIKLVNRAKADGKSFTVDICRNGQHLPLRFARNFGG